MITCVLALCADTVVRDAETNSVSAVSLIEEIGASGFPLLVPRFSALFLLARELDDSPEADAVFKISLAEEELFRSPWHINFQDKLRSRSIIVLQGLVVPRPGTLRASLLIQDTEVGSWALPAYATGGPQLRLPLVRPADATSGTNP